jgi:hypothetical protein
MGAFREIEELRIKTQLLLAKSHVYRQSLELQCGQIQATTAWIDRAFNFIRSTYPVCVLLAPFIGYFTFKKQKNIRGMVANALLGIQLVRKLRALWELWKAKKPARDAD